MSAPELAKYVARPLALSDVRPETIATAFVNCSTVPVVDARSTTAGGSGKSTLVRFRKTYRMQSELSEYRSVLGSPRAVSSSAAPTSLENGTHKPNWFIEPTCSFKRNELIAELASMVDVGTRSDYKEENMPASMFRRYTRQCSAYRALCAENSDSGNRSSPDRLSPTPQSPSILSRIDSPRVSTSANTSFRQRSFGGLRSSSTNDMHLMMDEQATYTSRDELDARWRSPTLELELMQFCLACVEPSVWSRIAQLDSTYTNNLARDKDYFAFVSLSVAKLPAAEIMQNYATCRRVNNYCQNVLSRSSADDEMNFTMPVQACAALMTHYEALESVGTLLSFAGFSTGFAKVQMMDGARPYSALQWSKAVSNVDLTLLSTVVDGDVVAQSECFVAHPHPRGLLAFAVDDRSDRMNSMCSFVATGFSILQSIFKVNDPDFIFDALAVPAPIEVDKYRGNESVLSPPKIPKNVRFVEVIVSENMSATDTAPSPLEYNRAVLCLPPGLGADVRERATEGIVARGLVGHRDQMDMCQCEALSDRLMYAADSNAFESTLEFMREPIAGAKFRVYVWDNDSAIPEIDDNEHFVAAFKICEREPFRSRSGYALFFNTRLAFTHMCRTLSCVMLVTPSSSNVRYTHLPRSASKRIFSNTYEIGRMLALNLCNDVERNNAGRAMSLYALKRLVNWRSEFNSTCAYECSLLLRIIVDRILAYERSAHGTLAEVSIWSHLIAPFLDVQSEGPERIATSDNVKFDSFRPSAKRNIYIALCSYLSSDANAEHIRVHKRSLLMLHNTVLRSSKIVGQGESRRTVHMSELMPAAVDCVRIGLDFADRFPDESFVPFFDTACAEPTRRSGVCARDACRALYSLCASKELSDAQARQLFFDIKIRHVHALPKLSAAFRYMTEQPGRLDLARTEFFTHSDGGLSARRDVRQFTMMYNALIYLNRFPASYDQTSMDAMLQNYKNVYFAVDPSDTANGTGAQRQYRGTVSLGQMTVHSLFYPVAIVDSAGSDSKKKAGKDNRQHRRRYYMPLVASSTGSTSVGTAENMRYRLGDAWRELSEKFSLDIRYVSIAHSL